MSMVNYSGYNLEGALNAVGPGWAKLVRRLWEAKPEGVTVTQVKEKYGGLRWYYDGEYEDTYSQLVSDTEEESYRTCETCGELGETAPYRPGGWVRTLCPVCAAARRMGVKRELEASQ